MALTGTFEELTNLFIFAAWIFYAFAVVALFRMRKTEPDLPRPYRCWGYLGFRACSWQSAGPYRKYLDRAPRPLLDRTLADSRGTSVLSALETDEFSC